MRNNNACEPSGRRGGALLCDPGSQESMDQWEEKEKKQLTPGCPAARHPCRRIRVQHGEMFIGKNVHQSSVASVGSH